MYLYVFSVHVHPWNTFFFSSSFAVCVARTAKKFAVNFCSSTDKLTNYMELSITQEATRC
jgi:hypothetical protein